MVVNGTSHSTPLCSGFYATCAYSFRRITRHLSPYISLFRSVMELSRTLDSFFLSFFASFPPFTCTPNFHQHLRHEFWSSFPLTSTLWGEGMQCFLRLCFTHLFWSILSIFRVSLVSINDSYFDSMIAITSYLCNRVI